MTSTQTAGPTHAAGPDERWEIIHEYSRAQAIEDGTLIDVTDTEERKAAFKTPVALTLLAYSVCVQIPSNYKGCQDHAGRLWDVLWLARCGAVKNSNRCSFTFGVHVRRFKQALVTREWEDGKLEEITLQCDIGPGDKGEPVLTIGFPEEF